ncbi:MAG: hypothetical protein ACK4GN_10520 [Runella sp.]
MANLSKVRSKAQLIGTLNPKAWDALKPKQKFPFSDATLELFVADTVKEASAHIADKSLAKATFELSKKMANTAAQSLVASWEPGDDICPPWPWPWPGPWPWRDIFGPQPDPWKDLKTAQQIEIAHILTHLSGLTSNQDFHLSLKSLAVGIVKGVASQLMDDFERCGTVPRPPIPRRR